MNGHDLAADRRRREKSLKRRRRLFVFLVT
jgi:hypothetical protein